jgi:DNA repair exonuclease SbcCD nuclease subunit
MVKKLIHIADIHIRTFQLHDLYKKQFEILIENLKKEIKGYDYEEVRVVIVGDLAHQKINISNEQMMLTSWFITQLVDHIGRVIIIPGNHDFLENNTQRMDSITPIVELLNRDEIKYYKDSGVYEDENINWVVYSLYQHNERPQFEKEEDMLYVGLFHGVIQGMSTDIGFQFEDGYDRLNFINLDLLLCGDIHKRQMFKLPNGGKAVMIGSLIQQNFGETIKHHGYGTYNVETDEYTFHDLKNEQPFLHFSINDIRDIENEKENLLNIG